ncbi:PAS domain-containing sensor histidine kinase [Hymenobacter puniceus]|uniref:PAS domain-containing sensor histidine kinase n=1 Tax=Hymenobacter sp. BT190 TaxID=2763505 RepID=UPI001651AD95|nr:PAS domain-containing sensor histidine kinase [Hymenobacter sp. BT190]MBC6699112.1 PAS domain-containing sensor histidine kinase [Hymenobacter sp. BT190]
MTDKYTVVAAGATTSVVEEAYCVFTLHGLFQTANQAFLYLAGCPAAALQGKSVADLLDPATARHIMAVLQELPPHAQILSLAGMLHSPSGNAQPVQLTLLPRSSEGQLTCMVRPQLPDLLTEKALHEQENPLSVIFASIADVIFVLEVLPAFQYRFLFANQAFETTTGIAREAIIGRLVQEVIPQPSLSLVVKNYRQAVETRMPVQWQETSNYPTGQLVGQVCVTPVLNDDGVCCQLVGIVHDLTAQYRTEERLRASNERFMYALKATTDAIYDWDVQADTLYWGEGFEDLFGYQLSGNPTGFGQWADYVHPEDAARTVDDLLHTTHNTSRSHWQQEYRFQRADSSWAIVFDRGYILRDAQGRAVRMIGAMQDITERKQAEEQQQRMAQEVYKQNADLQQFAYILSHNLRAPLANAEGFASLLACVPRQAEEFDTTLKYLHTSLQQVGDVLEDVNTILSARDTPIVAELELVPVSIVCQQVIKTLTPDLERCQGQVFCSIPNTLQLPGKRAYFYSIFLNLLTNAIKYRSADRLLRVDVEAYAHPPGHTIITIADNGSGFDMPPVSQDVFQLYKRFHTNVSGRGIGLFLVKAHVDSMGGSIFVHSIARQGTTFTLQFSYPSA